MLSNRVRTIERSVIHDYAVASIEVSDIMHMTNNVFPLLTF